MIPNRLLLRAATVLALTRNGVAPFPTMAGEGVFDTKMRPVTDLAQESMTPIILVYTDGDKRQNMQSGGGSPNWKRTCTLIIEIAIGSVQKSSNGGVGGVIGYLETDPEIEAMLDILECEVEVALMAVDNPWSLAWRQIARCIENWESVPYRSAEQAARYAVRQIQIDVGIEQDCVTQRAVVAGTAAVTVSGPLITVPYLSDLETMMKANPEVFASALALLSGARQQVTFPAFNTINIDQDYGADAPRVTAEIRR